MKILKIITVCILCVVLLLPMAFFNFTKDAVSEIDNRKLADSPFGKDGNFIENFEDYFNDRIGFRNEMILADTLFNDKVFGVMTHPSYTYGKDGYVFGNGVTVDGTYTEYHRVFARFVKKLQNYCEQRNIPFLFAIQPAKPAIYTEYLADGINYTRAWVDEFLKELDILKVNYVDNTVTMKQKKEEGIQVFNKKYDAHHWNDLGSYYGTYAMLEKFKQTVPTLNLTPYEDLNIGTKIQTSLQTSKFPINEETPYITIKGMSVTSKASEYKNNLKIDSTYHDFKYYVNRTLQEKGAPRALVFQGSYMNSYGLKYFANAFREYISVHNYRNVIDAPYYFNIFNPECVIFEVTEYTFKENYFSFEKMKNADFNPAISSLSTQETLSLESFTDYQFEKDGVTTRITWDTEKNYKYVWLELDKTYDMKKIDGGLEITVDSSIFESYKESLKILALPQN